MNALMKQAPNGSSPASTMTPNVMMGVSAANAEVNKLRQLQAKRGELQQQLQAIDAQIFKVQGALEVLQTLGFVTK